MADKEFFEGERGWNLYDSTDVLSAEPNSDELLRKGPVSALEQDRRYVLMPIAQDPRDPTQVNAELERVAVALNRETPTILFGRRMPIVGFRLVDDRMVKLMTPRGHYTSYQKAVKAARTLFDTKSLTYN